MEFFMGNQLISSDLKQHIKHKRDFSEALNQNWESLALHFLAARSSFQMPFHYVNAQLMEHS